MIDTVFGTKLHLTQAWDKAGSRMPITVIKSTPMKVTQVKKDKKDGYQAIQIGFGAKKWQRLTNPLQGHLKKSSKDNDAGANKENNMAPRFLREIKIEKIDEVSLGDSIKVSDVLKPGDQVQVTGISKGRGFAGVIKRWGFHGGPRTHGQSDRQRAPGSIGQGTDPGRVHKGKKMPGHYGAAQVTVRNLTVVQIDEQAGEIWLTGQVPGARNSLVRVKKTGQSKKFSGLFDPKADKIKITKSKKKSKKEKDQEKPQAEDKQTTPSEKAEAKPSPEKPEKEAKKQ